MRSFSLNRHDSIFNWSSGGRKYKKQRMPGQFFKVSMTIFFLWIPSLLFALHAKEDHRQVAEIAYQVIDKKMLVSPNASWQFGVGKKDITGPIAELGLMGYGSLTQVGTGLLNRLWARAYLFQAQDGRLLVFVNADLGHIFQSVYQGVIQRLQAKLPGVFSEKNVMLSATHTHSGPGGYSHRALYNITTLGHDKKNYQAIVNGISQAVLLAYEERKPGYLMVGKGKIKGLTANRSLLAYQNNPQTERDQYSQAVDETFTQLEFYHQSGLVGLINWFAVHPVSLSNKNTLVSGDNKGMAAWWLEQHYLRKYHRPIIAAFAQTNSGDVTPNIGLDGTGPTENQYLNNYLVGKAQGQLAAEIIESKKVMQANAQSMQLDIRFQYLNMEQQQVFAQYTDTGKNEYTCRGALGYAFAAGTEDGQGPLFFYEGQLEENSFWHWISLGISQPSDQVRDCQKPKPILIGTGDAKPKAWTEQIAPIILAKIGPIAIAGFPGEITTMAGRRLSASIQEALLPENTDVIVAGLTNGYTHYTTTREEYQLQHYEGGSTLFGPWTLAAYQQSYSHLAWSIRNQKPVHFGPLPESLADQQRSFAPGIIYDQVPIGKQFGEQKNKPNAKYLPGDTIEVAFWVGHPANNLQSNQGYIQLEFQPKAANGPELHRWRQIATDDHPDILLKWKRHSLIWGSSSLKVTWQSSAQIAKGWYRFRVAGAYKPPGIGQSVRDFAGYSEAFKIVGQAGF